MPGYNLIPFPDSALIPFPEGLFSQELLVNNFTRATTAFDPPPMGSDTIATYTATLSGNLQYADKTSAGSVSLSSNIGGSYHYKVDFVDYHFGDVGTFTAKLLEASFQSDPASPGPYLGHTLNIFMIPGVLGDPTGQFTVSQITSGPNAGLYDTTFLQWSPFSASCTIDGNPCNITIDGINHVSEPETLALLLPGLLMIGVRRRVKFLA